MWLVFALASLPLVLGLSVLAQVLAARATGAEVYAVELSSIFAPRWTFVRWGVTFHVGPLPLEAEVRATFSAARSPRLGLAVRAAAPLFAVLPIAIMSLLASRDGSTVGSALAPGVALASGLVTLLCLRPHETPALIGVRRGAVLELLTAPWLTDDEVRERVAWELLLRACSEFDRGEASAAALRLARPEVTQYRHPTSTHVQAIVLLSLGERSRAEALLEGLVTRNDVEHFVAAYARNNLAYCDLLRGDPALLPRATALLRETYALGFRDGYIDTTWAALLIRHGHLEPGLELIAAALQDLTLARDRAEAQCFRAEALARLGRVAEARSVFAEAAPLVVHATLVARTRAVLEAAREGTPDPSEPVPLPDEETAPPPQVVAPPPRLPGPARPRRAPAPRAPRSRSKRRAQWQWAGLGAGIAVVVFATAAAWRAGPTAARAPLPVDVASVASSLGQLVVGLLLGVLLHELGHCAASLALGHVPLGLTLGVGPSLRRWRWGQLTVDLRLWWTGASYISAPGHGSWVKLRLWLQAAAGPLTNAALAVTFARVAWHDAATVNAVLACFNLLPLDLRAGFTPRSVTDGMQLIHIPRWDEEEVRLAVAQGPSFIGLGFQHEGHTRLAEWHARHALTIAPERNARLNLARLRFEAGDFAEARVLYEALLGDARVTDYQRAFVASELALVYVLQRSAELLPLAEQLSEEALASSPEEPCFVGAWAAVQHALGRREAGFEAMRALTRQRLGGAIDGALLCLQAEALAGAGRPGAAQLAVLDAERLGAPASVLAHAWALVGRPPVWHLKNAGESQSGPHASSMPGAPGAPAEGDAR